LSVVSEVAIFISCSKAIAPDRITPGVLKIEIKEINKFTPELISSVTGWQFILDV
jgi:hypothetical protein